MPTSVKCEYEGRCVALPLHEEVVANKILAALALEDGNGEQAVLFEEVATSKLAEMDGLKLCAVCPYRITKEAEG